MRLGIKMCVHTYIRISYAKLAFLLMHHNLPSKRGLLYYIP